MKDKIILTRDPKLVEALKEKFPYSLVLVTEDIDEVIVSIEV